MSSISKVHLVGKFSLPPPKKKNTKAVWSLFLWYNRKKKKKITSSAVRKLLSVYILYSTRCSGFETKFCLKWKEAEFVFRAAALLLGVNFLGFVDEKRSAVELLLVERCSVVQAMFVYDSNKASCGVQSGDSCDSSLLPAQSPFNIHSLYHSVAFALSIKIWIPIVYSHIQFTIFPPISVMIIFLLVSMFQFSHLFRKVK